MGYPHNLSVIAAIAFFGTLTACSESEGGNRSAAKPSVKAGEVEANATNSADPALNASDKVEATDDAAGDQFVIVMLGDSLTAGFGLNELNAPPAQIEQRLRAAGVEASVINAGVSGDTTGGGLARFDWSVTSAKPDLLVVALGANDYLGGVAPERAKENLAAIIKRAKGEGIDVALVGIAPRSTAAADPRGTEYSAIYPDLAAAFDIPLQPAMLKGVRDNPDLLQGDGLHPNVEGAAIIADNLAAFLAPIVAAQNDE